MNYELGCRHFGRAENSRGARAGAAEWIFCRRRVRARPRARDTARRARPQKAARRTDGTTHRPQSEFLFERDATRHHDGEPWLGLDWRAGVHHTARTATGFARRHVGPLAALHRLRRRFQRADVSAHHGGRTRAEMADHSASAAGGIVDGADVKLVLLRAVSIQPAAELRGAAAPETNRHRAGRGRPAARTRKRNCAWCWRRRKARPTGAI